MEPILGQIMMFGGNFAPKGWAFCNGQIMPIAQNQALYSLLGTMYGGDGRTTFALPDLRGKTPIKWGTLPGGSNYTQGQSGGTENVILSVAELPAHSHPVTSRITGKFTINASPNPGNTNDPTNNYLAASSSVDVYDSTTNAEMGSQIINHQENVNMAYSGGNSPHYNRQPGLTLNFVIALQGIFPSRG